MRLLLLHPGVASIDCNDCQRKWYDMETGLPKTYKKGEGQFAMYEGAQFCPCKNGQRCPKVSPERAKDFELTPQNRKCYEAWRRHQAAPYHPDQLDDVTRENFAILDGLVKEADRIESDQAIFVALKNAIVKRK